MSPRAVDRAKRSLSQHFLIDPNLQRRIVGELKARQGDTVLEVGPGHGELTRHLVGIVRRLIVVEKDDELARELRERWGGRPDTRVVHADALEADLSGLLRELAPPAEGAAAARGADGRAAPVRDDAPVREGEPAARPRVLSNLPYAITSPLLFRLLDIRPAPARLVLTMQAEVAERLLASPGGRDYGALTVGVRVRAAVRLALRVGRKAFRPVPAVDSATVVLEPLADVPPEDDLAALRTLTREAFGMRRKQLQKILRTSPEYALPADRVEDVCGAAGIDPRARPERLAPGDWLRLARLLSSL